MAGSDQPRLEGGKLSFFPFDIHLPDATRSRFGIFHDLAGLLDEEYQEDAVAAFRREAGRENPQILSRLSIDSESGCVFINATKPDSILFAALIINRLSVPPYRRQVDESMERRLRSILRSWKRPKRHPWRVGDVFAAPLCDGTFAYGQVLGSRSRSPTCALLECRSDAPRACDDDLLGSRILSILHLGPDLLDEGVWTIIGNVPPLTDPDSGPCGDGDSVGDVSFGSGEPLVDLAEAVWGLKPWNVGWYGEEDHFGSLLMQGISRPKTAWILSPAERERYREERGITG